ncbi:hydroxyacid dehydrogenase [Arthrobacter glacialis]|uniref:Oxidoreductase n=1 Tax=Arthrobacter glacialis TaxID=1664 RepID=A0A2S4A1N3_ARTGL|nr:hydroxyacid dehydrogenase [Arthrobacter glacialis]POH75415.1 oxidoreductase [Arthrobacter glacialis]
MSQKLRALLVMNDDRRADVYPRHVLDRLEESVDFCHPPLNRIQLAASPDLMNDVDVLLTSWGAPRLDANFLASAPNLKAVLLAAGSIKEIVTDDFWSREIPIVSAAAANAIPVAEFTLAQILLSLKRAPVLARETARAGALAQRPPLAGTYGSRVGLLSLGEIGLQVARFLQAFSVDVVAHDPYASTEQATAAGVELVTLQELFASSQVVSIHCPLLPATRGMVNRDLLESMQPDATLINTARGALINESDLIDVLAVRPDLTAMLDVTWPEPPAPGSPLYTLPNVFLTPHIAGSLGSECGRLGALVADECERFVKNENLIHEVSQARAQKRA